MSQLGYQFNDIIDHNEQYMSLIETTIQEAEYWKQKFSLVVNDNDAYNSNNTNLTN